MTAPALSPAEQSEVSRFGVHDEEILRDLAEHFDDVIPCGFGAEPATHRIIVRCCNASGVMCTKHANDHRRFWGREARRRGLICAHCKHDWPRGSYDDIVRVVIL